MPQEIENTSQPKRGPGRPRIHPLTPAQIASREALAATRACRTKERAIDRKALQAIKHRDIEDSKQPPIEVLLVTVKRAAEALQISEKSVWVAMKQGLIPYVHILGSRRIATDDLRRLASTGTAKYAE